MTSDDAVQQAREWLRQQTGSEPPDERGSPDAHEQRTAEGRPEAHDRRPDADPDADPESVARAILVRKLAAQDRTRQELASALAAKNVPAQLAEQLLDRFQEIGLVDDHAFARRWVESRQGRRHRSRVALRRELAGKGIDREVIDEAVSKVDREDEIAAAQAYVDRVAGQLSGLDPMVRRRRLADRLARRGFGIDVIGRVLKDSSAE